MDNATDQTRITQSRRVLWRPARWLACLRDAMEQASARRDLAELDDRMLADIGVSRGEAVQEAGRSFLDRAPLPVDPSRMRPFPGGAFSGKAARPDDGPGTRPSGIARQAAHHGPAGATRSSAPGLGEFRSRSRSSRP